MRLSTATVLLGLLCAAPGAADPSAAAAALPDWRFGGYLGGARHSPVGRWGLIPDRDHVIVGLHGSATVFELGRLGLAYAPELVPLLLITPNPKYATAVRVVNGTPQRVVVERGSGPVWGAGLAPLGIEVDMELDRRWSAYGAAAVGAVWFTRDVPVANSRDMNYTFQFGGGLLWEYHPGRWIRCGYQYHHLSNLDSAPENPGLDGNVIYVGWQWLWRRPR